MMFRKEGRQWGLPGAFGISWRWPVGEEVAEQQRVLLFEAIENFGVVLLQRCG